MITVSTTSKVKTMHCHHLQSFAVHTQLHSCAHIAQLWIPLMHMCFSHFHNCSFAVTWLFDNLHRQHCFNSLQPPLHLPSFSGKHYVHPFQVQGICMVSVSELLKVYNYSLIASTSWPFLQNSPYFPNSAHCMTKLAKQESK